MYLFILLIPETGASHTPIENKILEYTCGFTILPDKLSGKYKSKSNTIHKDTVLQYLIACHMPEIQEIARFAGNYLGQECVMFWKHSEYVEMI